MKAYRAVLIIGIIEILIGSLTLLVKCVSIFFNTNTASANTLLFVIIAASISTLIGIGILRFNRAAYNILLYFSSVIILSKFLLFLGVIQLNGALETLVPNTLKSLISIAYHGFVIFYLSKRDIRAVFHA